MYMHVLYGAADPRKGRLRSFRDDDDDDDDLITPIRYPFLPHFNLAHVPVAITLKLRIEVPGLYQYKLLLPPRPAIFSWSYGKMIQWAS